MSTKASATERLTIGKASVDAYLMRLNNFYLWSFASNNEIHVDANFNPDYLKLYHSDSSNFSVI